MSEYEWKCRKVRDLTKDWPDGARPKWCHWLLEIEAYVDRLDVMHVNRVSPDNAAALHAISGLEWLARHGELVYGEEAVWFLRRDHGDRRCWEGPTLLHAVSAAIRSTT